MKTNIIYRVVSIQETITVPAGTFDNCLKIKMLFKNYEGNIANILVTYYAKGVGRVMTVHEKTRGNGFQKRADRIWYCFRSIG